MKAYRDLVRASSVPVSVYKLLSFLFRGICLLGVLLFGSYTLSAFCSSGFLYL